MSLAFSLPLSTLLGRVQAVLTVEFDERLKAAGAADLSLSLGTNVMRHLVGDEPVRLGELAQMAGVTKQAISQQVAYLASRGYLTIDADPTDSRAKTVRMTAKGLQSQQIGRPLFGRLEKDWEKRFGPDDIRQLRRILEHILEQLDDTAVVPRRRGGRVQGP